VDVIPVVRDTVILPEEFTKITGSDFKQKLESLNLFNCWELLTKGQSAAKPEREGSTTIESIFVEKYYKEEASRVHESGNGRYITNGKRMLYKDIV
jgi:hypothetical protein